MSEKESLLVIVDEYIENEIDYIKSEIKTCANDSSLLRVLNYLENINNEEKENIALDILSDDELFNKLYETIHYYLYHRVNK